MLLKTSLPLLYFAPVCTYGIRAPFVTCLDRWGVLSGVAGFGVRGGSDRMVAEDLHVAELVRDSEGGAQAILLADGAAPVWVAHGPQLGQP